jgi:hypothetical protein
LLVLFLVPSLVGIGDDIRNGACRYIYGHQHRKSLRTAE